MGSFNVALLDALLSVGVPLDRARNVVELFDRSVDERYGLHAQMLATKGDLAELETRLTREMARLDGDHRTEIATVRTEIAIVRTEIAGVRTEIAETRSDLIKWTLAALTAQTALLLGVLRPF